MEKFISLREKYGEFIYKGFSKEFIGKELKVAFEFEIPGLENFSAEWKFKMNEESAGLSQDNILDELLFNLGMVEAISYYKVCCPKNVYVPFHNLSDEQCKWWQKLFFNGLGEFMYINDIDIQAEELVKIQGASNQKKERLHDKREYKGKLIPVGGGKDSVVSAEILKDEDVCTYHVNQTEAVKNVIEVYGTGNDICANRAIDKKLIELNKSGFLNGHTPFSAIVAFSAFIESYLNGKKYIVLSNEGSANDPTVKGSFINHQYSKSFEFEKDFTEYMRTVTDSDIHYFSFLRPLNELQIAALFSSYKRYHGVFRSCNKGSKEGIWCCNCAKCLFVYIILLPFLKEEELFSIFGENLLEKKELEKDFTELIGIGDVKPFECVGTVYEVCTSLGYFIDKGGKTYLTDKYVDVIRTNQKAINEPLTEFNHEHNVPEELLGKLLKEIKEKIYV